MSTDRPSRGGPDTGVARQEASLAAPQQQQQQQALDLLLRAAAVGGRQDGGVENENGENNRGQGRTRSNSYSQTPTSKFKSTDSESSASTSSSSEASPDHSGASISRSVAAGLTSPWMSAAPPAGASLPCANATEATTTTTTTTMASPSTFPPPFAAAAAAAANSSSLAALPSTTPLAAMPQFHPSPAVAALLLQVAMTTGPQQQMQQPQQMMNSSSQNTLQQQPPKKQKRSKAPPPPPLPDGKGSRVPCRARGMPPDHIYKTAHFEIPPDVTHGQELLCSYPACRDAGVKFRFCTFCRIPVAKRNFRMRHNHCDEIGVFPGPVTQSLAPTFLQPMQANPSGNMGIAPVPQPTFCVETNALRLSKALSRTDPHYQPTASTGENNTGINSGAKTSPDESSIALLEPRKEDASKAKMEDQETERTSTNVKLSKQKKRSRKCQGDSAFDRQDDEQEPNLKKKQRGITASSNVSSTSSVNTTHACAMPRQKYRKGRKHRDHRHMRHHRPSTGVVDQNIIGCHIDTLKQQPKQPKRKNAFVSETRAKSWASLLKERPLVSKDDESMSKWLMRVMAVSNLSAPLPSAAAAAPVACNKDTSSVSTLSN